MKHIMNQKNKCIILNGVKDGEQDKGKGRSFGTQIEVQRHLR